MLRAPPSNRGGREALGVAEQFLELVDFDLEFTAAPEVCRAIGLRRVEFKAQRSDFGREFLDDG